MKKLISSILVALIIFSIVSVPAHAAENATITIREAVELACEIFPEYESQIRGSNPIQKDFSRNADKNLLGNIVVRENRITEDGEIFTYQEDSRGVVVITFTHGSTLVDSSSGTGYAYRKCNLVMYCNVSDEILQVKNFEYTHVQGGYDVINSYGSTASSSATVRSVIGNTQESAIMKAFVHYYVSFTANKQGLSGEVQAYLQAEVGEDSCTYSVHQG